MKRLYCIPVLILLTLTGAGEAILYILGPPEVFWLKRRI
jgi:hypothetical protein